MTFLRVIGARLRAALRAIAGSTRADDDLREELAAHLEMHVEDNIRRGLPPDEARRQALLAAGGVTVAAEAVRERRGLPLVADLASDVRYAARLLLLHERAARRRKDEARRWRRPPPLLHLHR